MDKLARPTNLQVFHVLLSLRLLLEEYNIPLPEGVQFIESSYEDSTVAPLAPDPLSRRTSEFGTTTSPRNPHIYTKEDMIEGFGGEWERF